MHRHSQCADTLAQNLEDLKRQRDIESLRPYLIEQNCFPTNKNPNSATITVEELKKLGRIWKIQDRRNLVKSNADMNDLVFALLQYIEHSKKYGNKQVKLKPNSTMSPLPPQDSKPSSPRIFKMKNICNLKQELFRLETPQELSLKSRVFSFPLTSSPIQRLVNDWRTEDMNAENFEKKERNRKKSQMAFKSAADVIIASRTHRGSTKQQIAKHRNLAAHLVNYSASEDLSNSSFNLRNIQTFISLSDTDDNTIASYCMLALSNVSSFPVARQLLIEINALSKLTSLQQLCKEPRVQWASALLFYNFSCDSEVEDRIYGACSSMLQSNSQSENDRMKLVSLFTLNNLLPCIDRHRVTEVLVSIFQTVLNVNQNEKFDISMLVNYLKVVQNICAFSNTHLQLLTLDMLDVLAHLTAIALNNKSVEMGALIGKVMQAMLYSVDNIAQMIHADFVNILVDVVHITDISVIRPVIKSLSILSSIRALVTNVCDSDVVTIVTSIIDKYNKSLPVDIARDAARYLANIAQPSSKEYLGRLVVDAVPTAAIQLIQLFKGDSLITSTAVKALQNILSQSISAKDIAHVSVAPLMNLMKDRDDIGAIHAMFNIACVSESTAIFTQQRIHSKLLDFLCHTKSKEAKSAYLRVLVQLASDSQCVLELLEDRLVEKLENQISTQSDAVDWHDLSKLLLAVCAYKQDLQESDRYGITKILRVICASTEDSDVIGQCALVVAFLSLFLDDFNEVDYVLRAILKGSATSDLIMEALSTVLYNMSCSAARLPMLLADNYYCQVMIKLMRSGVFNVQNNVAETMRNICSHPKSVTILLQSDALSDLIVIALLRTSSVAIKEVCSDIFYNMLCHEPSRQKLIQGDLWWAISRLSRTESELIQDMSIRVLLEMSCDTFLVPQLREHHILTFVKDLVLIGSTEEFCKQCLDSVLNIVGSFTGKFAVHEIVALIRIACNLLTRCKNASIVEKALLLLVISAQQHNEESDVEFTNQDILGVLEASRPVWSTSGACKDVIAYFIWEASKSELFTRSVQFSDLASVLCEIYNHSNRKHLCEFILGTIQHYLVRGGFDATSMLNPDSPLLEWILADCLGLSRSHDSEDHGRSGESTSSIVHQGNSGSNGYDAYHEEDDSPRDKRTRTRSIPEKKDSRPIRPLATRALALSVLANSMYSILERSPQTLSHKILDHLITKEHITAASTRDNLLYVIHSVSKHPMLSHFAIQTSMFEVFHAYLLSPQTRPEKVQEFIGVVLFNISRHRVLVPDLIEQPNGLVKLLTELIDQGPQSEVLFDITSVFYAAVSYQLKNEYFVNSKYVLQSLQKISSRNPQEEVIQLGKYVIGVILEKFSQGISVDPMFIQSMFTEILTNSLATIPHKMAVKSAKESPITPYVSLDLIKALKTPELRIPCTVLSERWNPKVATSRKRMTSVLVNITNQEPVLHAKLVPADIPNIPTFSKILVSFPRLELDDASYNAIQNDSAFMDEGEEDENDISNISNVNQSNIQYGNEDDYFEEDDEENNGESEALPDINSRTPKGQSPSRGKNLSVNFANIDLNR